jgi:hypothetical protein
VIAAESPSSSLQVFLPLTKSHAKKFIINLATTQSLGREWFGVILGSNYSLMNIHVNHRFMSWHANLGYLKVHGPGSNAMSNFCLKNILLKISDLASCIFKILEGAVAYSIAGTYMKYMLHTKNFTQHKYEILSDVYFL